MNYIEGKDRTQFQMECMEEYVDQNSEVRVIDKVVDVMDLKSLKFNIGNNETTGRPMYEPKDMLKLYIYGYFNGIRSSRKLAKQSKINREVIWLLKGLQPKQRVIADFRKDNSEALFNVFETFVDFCIDLGLYGKKLIAVDGTKIEASASKRKNYSKNKIARMKMKVQEKIDEYMKELEENDLVDQDITLDFDKAKLEIAIEKLKEKQIFYKELEKQLDETNENEINFTDKDSKTMKFGAHQGTDLGYNIQTAVDDKYNLIVTYDVSNNSADQGQLYNMSKKATEKLEVDNIEVLADKGYFDVDDLKNCEENNITAYVAKNSSGNSTGDSRYFSDTFIYNFGSNSYTCPEGKILYCLTKKFDAKDKRYANYEVCDKCKNKQYCTTSKKGRTVIRTKDKDFIELVNRRTKKNSEKYKQRQSIVEHPFGTIKRAMGFYHLLTRGFRNVRGEISIAFFTYNLKRTINILGVRRLMGCLA